MCSIIHPTRSWRFSRVSKETARRCLISKKNPPTASLFSIDFFLAYQKMQLVLTLGAATPYSWSDCPRSSIFCIGNKPPKIRGNTRRNLLKLGKPHIHPEKKPWSSGVFSGCTLGPRWFLGNFFKLMTCCRRMTSFGWRTSMSLGQFGFFGFSGGNRRVLPHFFWHS